MSGPSIGLDGTIGVQYKNAMQDDYFIVDYSVTAAGLAVVAIK